MDQKKKKTMIIICVALAVAIISILVFTLTRSSATAQTPVLTGGTTSAPPATKDNETIATEVILGLWGNGDERKQRLTAAGYDYEAVQAIVNEKLKQKEEA